MDDLQLTMEYLKWMIIIGLTLQLFSFFSKKHTNIGQLLILVLGPVWLIIAVIEGLLRIYFESSYRLMSFEGFAGLLVHTLPSFVLFGVTTYCIKYYRFQKIKSQFK